MKPIFKIKNWQLLKARGVEGRVVLPAGDFVAVGKRAFVGKQNQYLESVAIPDGVSVIKAEAFAGDKNLRTVVLSTNGNIGLSQGVFAGCTRLREVANSEYINSIGALAFSNCAALQGIAFGKHLHRIGEGAFANCQSLTSVSLPSSLREIGKGAFAGCRELAFYSADDALPALSEEMFRDCVSLREAIIPAAVSVIPRGAFEGCISLREVKIPANVNEIEARVFKNCRKLHTVRMELGIKEIGAHAFDNCPALREVFVPHSLKKLGYGAFGTGKRKDGEKITVCVENEYMVRRMKSLLFWCGSANCTEIKLIGKSIEERKRDRRRANVDAKGTHLIG